MEKNPPNTTEEGGKLTDSAESPRAEEEKLEEDMELLGKKRSPEAPIGPFAAIIIILVLVIIGGLYVGWQKLSALNEVRQEATVQVGEPEF